MSRQASQSAAGFRAAIAFYPGCGPRAVVAQDYAVASPVTVFLGGDDEEVSPAICHRLLDSAQKKASPIRIVDYPGATHDFDDPGPKRQSVAGNRSARDDVLQQAAGLFATSAR